MTFIALLLTAQVALAAALNTTHELHVLLADEPIFDDASSPDFHLARALCKKESRPIAAFRLGNTCRGFDRDDVDGTKACLSSLAALVDDHDISYRWLGMDALRIALGPGMPNVHALSEMARRMNKLDVVSPGVRWMSLKSPGFLALTEPEKGHTFLNDDEEPVTIVTALVDGLHDIIGGYPSNCLAALETLEGLWLERATPADAAAVASLLVARGTQHDLAQRWGAAFATEAVARLGALEAGSESGGPGLLAEVRRWPLRHDAAGVRQDAALVLGLAAAATVPARRAHAGADASAAADDDRVIDVVAASDGSASPGSPVNPEVRPLATAEAWATAKALTAMLVERSDDGPRGSPPSAFLDREEPMDDPDPLGATDGGAAATAAKKNIGALKALLKTKQDVEHDPSVRDAAAKAMHLVSGGDASWFEHKRAPEGMTWRSVRDAVLEGGMTGQPRDEYRKMALELLFLIRVHAPLGDPDAIDVLWYLLTNDEGSEVFGGGCDYTPGDFLIMEVRWYSLLTLRFVAERGNAHVVDLAIALRDGDPTFELRYFALKALSILAVPGDRRVALAYVRALRDRETAVKFDAVTHLARHVAGLGTGDAVYEAVVLGLEDMFGSADGYEQFVATDAAVRALARCERGGALEAMLLRLHEKSTKDMPHMKIDSYRGGRAKRRANILLALDQLAQVRDSERCQNEMLRRLSPHSF